MSIYNTPLIFNDSEVMMMKEALKLMIKHCEKQISEDVIVPYLAHKEIAEEVLQKLVTKD